ncbi:MAG: hypothetical protein M1825_004247 [Sarcosagium campestre]|nr:MAG: hypothetical protein M1825_004247 [Sarcosagium campestre]
MEQQRGSANLTSTASPPSPTLTNPDMILPYGNDIRAMTPSPPAGHGLRPSHSLHSLHSVRSSGGLGSHPPYAMVEGPPGRESTLARSTSAKRDGLYNIAEQGPRAASHLTESVAEVHRSPTLPSSPVLPFDPRTTPSEHSDDFPVSAFEDSDDDDEPNEESDDEDAGLQDTKLSAPKLHDHRFSNGTIIEEESEDESSAVLTLQAEEILANAKKTLDNMEGNLSRARHSLILSPSSPSPSPINGSPFSFKRSPSAEPNLRRLPFGLGISPARHRQLHSSQQASQHGTNHSRVFSETSVPSSLYTSQRSSGDDDNRVRAQSASGGLRRIMGEAPRSTNDGNQKYGLFQPSQPGQRNYLSPVTAYVRGQNGPRSAGLERLQEHGDETHDGHQAHQNNAASSLTDISATTSPHDLNGSAGLSRSRSTNQIRDVRDQMKDLKGRISSLQQRAREDGLKRRSLQNLRTPSPFTAAEQWYLSGNQYRGYALNGNQADFGHQLQHDESSRSGGDAILESDKEQSFDMPMEPSFGEDESELDTDRTSEDGVEKGEVPPGREVDQEQEDDHGLDGEDEDGEKILEDYVDGYGDEDEGVAEVDEIITTQSNPDYEDASTHPVGERHEDRPDAFDYEHFFLHSGLSGYNDPSRRDSMVSIDSRASVETARPVNGTSPHATPAQRLSHPNYPPSFDAEPEQDQSQLSPRLSHNRQASIDSISTVATFATATEGEGFDEGSDDDGDGAGTSETTSHSPTATTRGWTTSSVLPGAYPLQSPLVLSRAGSSARSTTTTTTATTTATQARTSTPDHRDGSPDPPTSASLATPRPSASRITALPPSGTSRPTPSRRHSLPTDTPEVQPRPTSILLSALLTAQDKATPTVLSAADRELIDQLVGSLARACSQLGDQTVDEAGDTWRQRVVEARRILDGEIDHSVSF